MKSVWLVYRNLPNGLRKLIDVCASRARARNIIKRRRGKNPGATKHTYVAQRHAVRA